MNGDLLPFDAAALTDLCGELDAWRERLDHRVSLTRTWAGRLRRELEAEAIGASLAMEQVPVSVDDVRRILAGQPPPAVSLDDVALVTGYRDAMAFVLRRADEPVFRWSREIVTGIHDRVLAGRWSLGAGRIRDGVVVIVSGSGAVMFTPPLAAEVPALVDHACDLAESADWHPGVLSAWVHLMVAAIHPFSDGNGRTARIAASLAMFRGGFRLPEFTSLEEWWGRNRGDYYGAFACLGTHFDRHADSTPFLIAHLRAQVDQVRSLDLRQRVDGEIWTLLENIASDLHLPARIANALWDAFFGREVTSTYYGELADLSPASARIDLAAAVTGGLLTPTGERRFRRYLAGPRLYPLIGEHLGVPVAHHPASRDILIAELSRRRAN